MTRIEFQLRRDALRGFAIVSKQDGIQTWQDWCEYKSDIVHYLTTRWLLFTEETFNKRHTERILNNPDTWHHDWVSAIYAFEQAFGRKRHDVTRTLPPLKCTADKLTTQSLSCGQSAIIKQDLRLSRDDPNWPELVATFQYASTLDHLSMPDNRKRFWKRWTEKLRRQKRQIPEEASHVPSQMEIRGAGVTHKQPPGPVPGATGGGRGPRLHPNRRQLGSWTGQNSLDPDPNQLKSDTSARTVRADWAIVAEIEGLLHEMG